MCDYGIYFVNRSKIDKLRQFASKAEITSKELLKSLYEQTKAVPEGYYLGEVSASDVLSFLGELVPLTTAKYYGNGDDTLTFFTVKDFLKAIKVNEDVLLSSLKEMYDKKDIETDWNDLEKDIKTWYKKNNQVGVLDVAISENLFTRDEFVQSDIALRHPLDADLEKGDIHYHYWADLIYTIFYSRLNLSNIDEDDNDSLFYIKEE